MATPGEATAREARSYPDLSNAELGDLWAATLKQYALGRTGSSRDFWRKLLDGGDVQAVLQEFKRRASERQEEYEAWMQLHEAGRL